MNKSSCPCGWSDGEVVNISRLYDKYNQHGWEKYASKFTIVTIIKHEHRKSHRTLGEKCVFRVDANGTEEVISSYWFDKNYGALFQENP